MQFNLNLSQQLDKLVLGDHICLIYKDEIEQMSAVIPYLKLGLARNEFCAYIVDDRTVEEVKSFLAIGGIDVEAEISRGALSFASKRETYFLHGGFRPVDMLNYLKDALQTATDKGFTGFRITGEMTWALGKERGCSRVIEFESLLNDFYPGSKSVSLCQYNSEKFDSEILRDAIRTHPIAIIDGEVCNNVYYENPEIFHVGGCADKKVSWMREQLKSYHKTQMSLLAAIQCRDEFLSIASHELKTPLTSLKLQSQSFSRILAKNGPMDDAFRVRVEKTMATTEKQVERLCKLVDDLLDVAHINAGKFRIKPEKMDLAEILTGVIERFSNQAKDKNVVFIADLSASIIGDWDKFRLEQVFSNLISNSLKYGSSPIEIKISQVEDSASISVKDNGVGIKLLDQAKIFDRYERAIHHNEVSGLGLGLYITRDIVEAHYGTIEVDSCVGQGATFSIKLPLAPFQAST